MSARREEHSGGGHGLNQAMVYEEVERKQK